MRETRRKEALLAQNAISYEERKEERAGMVAMGYCQVRSGTNKGLMVHRLGLTSATVLPVAPLGTLPTVMYAIKSLH